MSQRRHFSFFLVLLSLFGSFPAMAITDQIQALSAGSFTLVFWGLVGLSGVLLIALLVKSLGAKKSLKRLASQQQTQSTIEARIDNLNSGVVYYDSDRSIVYANKTAAYVLGQKAEDMVGKSLSMVFPDEMSRELEQAVEGVKERSIQHTLPSRSRDYRIRVSPKLPDVTGCTGLVLLEDINEYQVAINNREAYQSFLRSLWAHPLTGLITLNMSDKSVTASPTLETWVQAVPQSSDSVSALFDDADQNQIEQIIQRLAEPTDEQQENVEETLEVSLRGKSGAHPVSLNIASATSPNGQSLLIHLTLVSRMEESLQEKAAKDSQKRLQTLNSMMPVASYRLDADMKVVECNRYFATVFGVDPIRVKGKPLSDAPVFSQEMKDLHYHLETSVMKQAEVTLSVEGGSDKFLRLYLQPQLENGERAGMLVVVEDLTERVTLKRERDEATKRLESFIDQSPMGVMIFDHDDKITEVNHTLSKQLSLPADDICGRSFYSLFEQSEHASKAQKKLHRHDQFSEMPAKLKTSLKPISATLYASKFSEIPEQYICWVGGRDEQDYLNNRFERLLKYASVPIGIVEADEFTHLNSAACAFFGIHDEDELLGKGPDNVQLHTDEAQSQKLTERLNKVRVQGQVQTFTWQHTFRGEVLPSELTLIPMLRNGELQCIVCIWVDLRALEQANAARMEALQLREAAEQEVAEKEQLLASSQSELEQQSATLAQTEKTLASTEQRLSKTEEHLSEKLDTLSSLQKAHKDITEHLASLQDDYAQNKALLAQSQQANAALEDQLEQSSSKVVRLEQQRNQIAEKLQYSEKQFRHSQQQLSESQQETQRLEQAQRERQQEAEQYLSQINELKSSIEEKDKQLADVSGQINSLQTQLAGSNKASETLREQLINQKKASEEAQRQRREIELACRAAESELAAKARNIEHLQHEMKALEEMSQQEKGDMEAYAKQLQQELESKQSQLATTEQALNEIRQQAEQDKQEKAQQQSILDQLQREMKEAEEHAKAEQEKLAKLDAQRKEEQARLQQALEAKQQQLSETIRNLEEARKVNEDVAQEKARQESKVDRLQQEMQLAREEAEAQQRRLAEENETRKAQHAKLLEELEAKQSQLQETKAFLNDAKQQTEAEKSEKARQEAIFEQLQTELRAMEEKSAQQLDAIEQTDKARQAEQDALEQALNSRQKELDETRAELAAKEQQMEQEKQARQQQQALLEKLQTEMASMEADAVEQRKAQTESEKQREEEQKRLAEALESKQGQLEDARKELEERQKQMEAERLAREEQQAMLEQLKSELSDVAQRAEKQKQMMSGSDEQWRKHNEEIEEQKKQLKQALEQAKQQNNSMQSQLEQSREALTEAEGRVSQTQNEEQKLQEELNAAKQQAEELQARLVQQEEKEAQLQQQVKAQHAAMQQREQNINELEEKQKALTAKLAAVEQEYSQTKATLDRQGSSQSELNEQLKQLEGELESRKSQLSEKEKALQSAQSKLKDSESKLAEQEQALVDAQKAELQKELADAPAREVPAFAKLPMPPEPNSWFDLLPYLQQNEQVESLAQSLTSLMDNLSDAIDSMDEAVGEDNNGKILMASRKLVSLIKPLHSAPLDDMAFRFESDFESKNIDNISIFWPTAKKNLLNTLRVVYSHLHQ